MILGSWISEVNVPSCNTLGTSGSSRTVDMPSEPKRDWKFRVQVNTLQGESVSIVGNCTELGNWMNSKSVQLTKEPESQEGSNIWSVVCKIPENVDVEFRYYVCIVVDPSMDSRLHTKHVIVRRSETNVTPRIITTLAGSNVDDDVVDIDSFGCYDNFTKVERGWLTTETVIQLKLCNNPIALWSKKYNSKKINVKVTPITLSRRSSFATEPAQMFDMSDMYEESMDTQDTAEQTNSNWPITELSVMNPDEYEYKQQTQFGRPYNQNDVLAFKINMHFPESVAYLIDYYVYGSRVYEEEPPYHFGFSYILPSILKSSSGQAIVPITSVKHRPIGQITVEYVVIRPIKDFECDMSVSYSRVWRPTWLGLDVGHRGAGNSFKDKECAIQGGNTIRENTIASLKMAASHGADFVEFDVQLSKDLVPVLYHDFHVCMAIKRKDRLAESDMLEMPLKDLTLQQLRLLKIYHVTEGKDKNQRFFDEDLEDHQPFPTLEQAFQALDPHVGFNIEIKWTMELKDGTFELNHPFDLNMYLDTVLKVVLQHGGNRKIIFSCFHPDICTMIRLKQNKYPVIFLTMGVTIKYDAYNDPRTQGIPIGVHFALSEGILGLNVHTEDILRDPSQVKMVTNAGLVIFCWGDDNNDPATIRYLKNLGLHAIIYDKIDEFSSKEVKESIFLVEARESAIAVLKNIEQSNRLSERIAQPPARSISEYVFELERMQEVVHPTVSTSSSLGTLRAFPLNEAGDAGKS